MKLNACSFLGLCFINRNGSVKVSCSCIFATNSTTSLVTPDTIGAEFRAATEGAHWLGSVYQLLNTSLAVAEEQNPHQENQVTPFSLLFTISKLLFSSDVQNMSSQALNSSVIADVLNNLYRNSEINGTFLNCNVLSLRPVDQVTSKVQAVCNFQNESAMRQVDRATVYHEFRDNRNILTSVGLHLLNNFTVNGYQEATQITFVTTMKPIVSAVSPQSGDLPFGLNFTIINRNFIEELENEKSPEYRRMVINITILLTQLFSKSNLKDIYRTCEVVGLRNGSVKVISKIYFKPNNPFLLTAEKVKREFNELTNGTRWLGNVYQLRNSSLSVGKSSNSHNGEGHLLGIPRDSFNLRESTPLGSLCGWLWLRGWILGNKGIGDTMSTEAMRAN
ncbi:uncharacterized protein LOC127582740 [Pristis pectinata]|uniref:uncharacterized protein LOC127582740 n=1 Tax=Pristis pectinata TaxID=685728 RepID=UPI00223CE463|nr:uncharacterized protein LOC127582740 [Pristis pectinata]